MAARFQSVDVRRMTSERAQLQLDGSGGRHRRRRRLRGADARCGRRAAGVTRDLIYHYFPAADRPDARGRRLRGRGADPRLADRRRRPDGAAPRGELRPLLRARVRAVSGLARPSARARARRPRGRRARRQLPGDHRSGRSRSITSAREEPGEIANAALRSYLAFGERVLDEWREGELDRERRLPAARRHAPGGHRLRQELGGRSLGERHDPLRLAGETVDLGAGRRPAKPSCRRRSRGRRWRSRNRPRRRRRRLPAGIPSPAPGTPTSSGSTQPEPSLAVVRVASATYSCSMSTRLENSSQAMLPSRPPFGREPVATPEAAPGIASPM